MTLREDSRMRVDHACRLAGVARAGYYRAWRESEPRAEETEVRDHIQQISLAHRMYGSRRVAEALRGEGLRINRKRVQRLMRLDNLLALRKRRFVATTDSRHSYAVYPNLAAEFEPSAPNQLWRADLTYIRLREGFVYLAVILDAYSRRVVGWALGETLEAELAVEALRRALAERPAPLGLIHHSDQGVQYCSHVYVELLRATGIAISMSRKGNPYDNAMAESFMRTLKCEEVYLSRYRDVEDARSRMADFLENYYNRRRRHSSLGYRSPAAFEEASA